MTADSQSIQQNTVSSSTVAGGSNIGNGVVNVSLLDNSGEALQTPYAENIVIDCTSDAQTGFATAGSESFTAQGEYAGTDPLAADWPLGSGASNFMQAISASQNNNLGCLTNNGAFENWTSNTPNNWGILTGTAGTEILKETTHVYGGAAALSYVGTGTNPSIAQVFNNGSTGTSANLLPLTTYSLSFWVRSSVSLGAGTLVVRLYDVTNSAVMVNAASVANSLSINLTSLTTSYVNHVVVFQTPRVLPASYRLEINAASIPSTDKVYLDHLSLGLMTPLYTNGPSLAVHSGSVPFILNDGFTTTVSNNYTSAWATLLEKFLSLNNSGFICPFSGSPTISDSLI
jgi:hypothetical protein